MLAARKGIMEKIISAGRRLPGELALTGLMN
jgi:hypothetical protein